MSQIIFNKNKLPDFCEKEQIQFLGIFGSFARGKANKTSDIDLLIRLGKRTSLLNLVRIERELGTLLGRKVDLVTESALNPLIRERVKKELKVLYEKQP